MKRPFMFCGDCIEEGNAMLKDYDEKIIEKVEKLKEELKNMSGDELMDLGTNINLEEETIIDKIFVKQDDDGGEE